KGVLIAQVAVRFHCKRAAVFMSEPARNSWNVDATLNAAHCEQMPQVVMRDAIRAHLFARAIKRLLALTNTKHLGIRRFAWSFAPHSFKQRAGIGNQWHTAQLPILRAGACVTSHHDLARVKVNVPPSDLAGFTDSATRERQARRKISTVDRVPAVAFAHLCNQRVKLVHSRQGDLFAA